ncbi:SCO family protein [Marinospirillum sp.]|uniref:SCO family protein n=1 Tax=Marinospirillum sp. TaxID=2183934 RepID=UPI0028705E23|nr:SCO family protein [Marinospirillum sp.]MDR9467772.1 SCO family protein [Marinospirillum sp.]
MRLNRTLLWVGLALLAIFAGLQIWTGSSQNPQNLVASQPTGAPFTLDSQQGEVSLSDLDDDQLALIYFGYTWCPDICPMSMVFLAKALKNLPEELNNRVQPIFISVDPQRDTPERLQAYVEFFEAGIIGVTGEEEELKELARQYGAYYQLVEVDSAMGYAVDHTSDFYLANNKGELVTTLSHNSSGNQLQEALIDALEKSPE